MKGDDRKSETTRERSRNLFMIIPPIEPCLVKLLELPQRGCLLQRMHHTHPLLQNTSRISH
ncbi:MAG: hypothetical protein A2X80_13505 [Geobacteraceae bacterium GWB2_52_12]|nr:MAG: hypothetical protein A2X80_13505 [Geobacteraceae bacterium GWB2_52_12]